eukprot:TRINITY_DN15380_c0_g1_i1.p1 TRINITY_DN15380_c0_g1~~TRINITY_DN15380_c0_g1_i1.p1  ORF type:complete len:675 (+),score=151.34 TRINITY_DN15380_c0_g1_i1:57-2027(+)
MSEKAEKRKSATPDFHAHVPTFPTAQQTLLDLLNMAINLVSIFSWVNLINSFVAFSLFLLLTNCSLEVVDLLLPGLLLLTALRNTHHHYSRRRPSKQSYARSELGRTSLISRLVTLRDLAKNPKNQQKVEYYIAITTGQAFISAFSAWKQHTKQSVAATFTMLCVQLYFGIPLIPFALSVAMLVFPFMFSWTLMKHRLPFLPDFTNLTPTFLNTPLALYDPATVAQGDLTLCLPPKDDDIVSEHNTHQSMLNLKHPPTTPLRKRKDAARDISPDLASFQAFTTMPLLSPPVRSSKHQRTPSTDLEAMATGRNSHPETSREREGSLVLDDPGTPPKKYTAQSGVYCAVVISVDWKDIMPQLKDLQEKKSKGYETGKVSRHDINNAACSVLLSLIVQQNVKYRVSKNSQAQRLFLLPEQHEAALSETDIRLLSDKSFSTKQYLPLNEERDLSVPYKHSGGKYTRGKHFERDLEDAISKCPTLMKVNKGFRQLSVTSDEHEKDILVALSYVASELFSERVSVVFKAPGDQPMLVFVTKIFPAPPTNGGTARRTTFPEDFRPDFNRVIVPPALLRQLVLCSCRMPTSLSVLSDQIAKVKYQYYRSNEMVTFHGDPIKEKRKDVIDPEHQSNDGHQLPRPDSMTKPKRTQRPAKKSILRTE